MTENEKKIKHRVQLVTGVSMVVFFVLVLTLTVQLCVIGARNKIKRSLEAKQKDLAYKLAYEQDTLDYYSTQKFIDEYALDKFGYGREGTKIFK
jgi:ABC-type Fe2+-enterobactin transport system substrate-binding protein